MDGEVRKGPTPEDQNGKKGPVGEKVLSREAHKKLDGGKDWISNTQHTTTS